MSLPGRGWRYLLLLLYIGGICEIGSRIAGERPLKVREVFGAVHGVTEPDAVVGWHNKPGFWPAYTERNDYSGSYTICSNGARRTAAQCHETGGDLLFFGCSFTNGGMVLSDEDTYPFMLQSAFPDLKVLNFGTPAFGGQQALLLLEREIKRHTPKHVVFGVLDLHEDRNIARWDWIGALSDASGRSVGVPRAFLAADGEVQISAPLYYYQFPLRHYSAFIYLLERGLNSLRLGKAESRVAAIATGVMARMAEVARDNGVGFTAVYLYGAPSVFEEYTKLLRAKGVEPLNCVHPETGGEAGLGRFELKADEHPNRALNEYWAKCIESGLSRDFSSKKR